MAKKKNQYEQDYAKEIQERNTPEFSPEWFEENRERILQGLQSLGVQIFTDEEIQKRKSRIEIDEVAKELGINFESQSINKDRKSLEDLINQTASYIDILKTSVQWSNVLSTKVRIALHAVRVFIRQCRAEKAPPGEASTLAELVCEMANIPEGVLNKIGDMALPSRKTQPLIKLNENHLAEAGIG